MRRILTGLATATLTTAFLIGIGFPIVKLIDFCQTRPRACKAENFEKEGAVLEEDFDLDGQDGSVVAFNDRRSVSVYFFPNRTDIEGAPLIPPHPTINYPLSEERSNKVLFSDLSDDDIEAVAIEVARFYRNDTHPGIKISARTYCGKERTVFLRNGPCPEPITLTLNKDGTGYTPNETPERRVFTTINAEREFPVK